MIHQSSFAPIVIFGARPCDAAAPQILAPLFGWDFHDVFFEARLKSLVFVVIACSKPVDNACFCTSVGVDPSGHNVGDVVLTELADGSFVADARTTAGKAVLNVIDVQQRRGPKST